MNYSNTQMKLDALVNYFNDEKINLNPVFQRGQIWPINLRRKLIANIVQGRPIPAIFLYKDADGARYTYNILDGKQRLESLILFVGAKRSGFAIHKWSRYFRPPHRKHVDFWVQLPSGKTRFANLPESVVRDFREYSIPTVEIVMSDDSTLDEIIGLFVDINQLGVAVARFDVVKAMGENNRLLGSVFALIALKERRAQSVAYKAKKAEYSSVLKHLKAVASASDPRAQVDRMWERLLEIVLFLRSRQHRKPVDILKSFIRAGRQGSARPSAQGDQSFQGLTQKETRQLGGVFRFCRSAYAKGLSDTPLASDQAHFYTMATSLIDSDLLRRYDHPTLTAKLISLGMVLDGKRDRPPRLSRLIGRYLNLSSDRTTDSDRREERQDLFVKLVDAI